MERRIGLFSLMQGAYADRKLRKQMKVLVTGSEGYIGVHLGTVLQGNGHEVVGLDTGLYRNGWLYDNDIKQLPASINKDIRHITEADLEGFDAVVHMAELSNDPLGQFNSQLTYQINHAGSVALAKKCKAVGIQRFVYTSSCSVYGAGNDDWKTEESELNPQTTYAECKAMVERDVSALADDNFSPVFLRNATAHGPSPRMRFDIVLNNLAGLAWTTGEIRMTSDGTPWRPLVHVLDICDAIGCVLESPREAIHNQIFNVGDTQENYRVREIAKVVAAIFPDCKLHIGRSDGDNRSYRVSFDKINERLGFKASRTIYTGAQELFEVFLGVNMTSETFKDRAFTRLHQLKYLVETGQIDHDFFWTTDQFDQPDLLERSSQPVAFHGAA
jgi:nucleoside-diphosphate-sugar epimerase